MSTEIDRLAEIAKVTRGRIDRLKVFADFFELFTIIISNKWSTVDNVIE